MTTAKPIARKLVKEILQSLETVFDITLAAEDYHFFQNNRNRIFLLKKSEHFETINLEFLRTDRMGLYLAEYKNGFLRPSMQGMQFLVAEAKKQGKTPKNMLEIHKEQAEKFFKGEELEMPEQADAQGLIVTYQGNILGFAQAKGGQILNYMPKTFRGTTIM